MTETSLTHRTRRTQKASPSEKRPGFPRGASRPPSLSGLPSTPPKSKRGCCKGEEYIFKIIYASIVMETHLPSQLGSARTLASTRPASSSWRGRSHPGTHCIKSNWLIKLSFIQITSDHPFCFGIAQIISMRIINDFII